MRYKVPRCLKIILVSAMVYKTNWKRVGIECMIIIRYPFLQLSGFVEFSAKPLYNISKYSLRRNLLICSFYFNASFYHQNTGFNTFTTQWKASRGGIDKIRPR